MAKLNEKQKLLAIGGGALGICLIAGGGVWWAMGLIDEVQKSIEQKRSEIAAVEVKISKIPNTEKDVIILRENLDEYVKILPETQSLNDYVTVLNQFAQQSGIQTRVLTPGKLQRTNSKAPERFSKIEYDIEMSATLWDFLKFINLIENSERFISITDFSITQQAGRDVETRDGEEVHIIKLKMETYTYNAKAAGEEVVIPNYADRKEELREEIFKRMQAIRIDKYEHRGQRGRRDIFADPREREGRADGPPMEEQKALLDRHLSELQKVRETVNKLKRADLTVFDVYSLQKKLAEDLERLDVSVHEVGQKQMLTAPQLRMRWVKEVVEPLAELRSAGAQKDPRATDDQFLSAEELQQLIAGMEQLLVEGDLEGADTRFESIASKVLVPEVDPRYPLAVSAKALHLKVKTAMEFREIELKIQGILVNHDGGRSGLLLNGSVYEEGDYISDDLMLRRVEEEQVWFVFRGLTLIRTL